MNNEAEDAHEEELIITETLAPYIYQDGKLIQYARVIIGTKDHQDSAARPEKKAEAEESAIGEDKIERIMEYAKIL